MAAMCATSLSAAPATSPNRAPACKRADASTSSITSTSSGISRYGLCSRGGGNSGKSKNNAAAISTPTITPCATRRGRNGPREWSLGVDGGRSNSSTRPGGGRGASSGSDSEGEFVDTRIHYDDPNEGWIFGDSGGFSATGSSASSSTGSSSRRSSSAPTVSPLNRDIVMAIMQVDGSHYQTLGVTPAADGEEVKSAYRRLTKLYHPDTTELPLELAEQKFVQLREAYSVLINAETRRLYDWKIAQQVSQRRGPDRFVWPYEVDASQRGAGPEPARWGGTIDGARPQRQPEKRGGAAQYGKGFDENGNMPLDDSSVAALTFDAFALVVAILCITYAVYFKN